MTTSDQEDQAERRETLANDLKVLQQRPRLASLQYLRQLALTAQLTLHQVMVVQQLPPVAW